MPNFVTHAGNTDALTQEFALAVQPVITGLTQFSVKIGDDYMALGTEWAEFMSRRLQSDLDLPVRLAGCGCPDAVMQAWSDFLTRAANDYQREFERLTDLTVRLNRDVATPQS